MIRINSVIIEDSFGTKSASFKPKSVTRFKGPNGSGKSSLIRALFEVFGGGTDPSMIRNGAEKSVVQIGLDDGTTITKTTRPKRARRGAESTGYTTDLEVNQPDGTPRNAPQGYINELASAAAVDPGKILRMDTTTAAGRKQLADLMLSIMPISFSPEDIAKKLAVEYRTGSEVAKLDVNGLALPTIQGNLDLDGLKKYSAAVTEQRRRAGTERDDADGAVNRMRQALPEDDGVDYDAELKGVEAYERQVRDADRDNRMEIERLKSEGMATATKYRTDSNTEIDAEIDEKIKELERFRTHKKQEVQKLYEAKVKVVTEAEGEAIATLKSQVDPALQSATADIATYKAKRDAQKRSQWTKEEIERNLTVYRVADRKYAQLSEVIARLDDMRKEKLASLPIPGLEVTADQVYYEGVVWANINTASKIKVALHLCTLISGELGIILIDDAEHLDEETRGLLEQGLVAAGFQLFEAIVSDDDALTIETVDLRTA